MGFKGLFNVFRSAIGSYTKTKSFATNIKDINKLIKSGVRKEGGEFSLFCYRVGFWSGFCLPGGSIFAPLTGATGAFLGKGLSVGGEQGLKLAKKCVSIFTH